MGHSDMRFFVPFSFFIPVLLLWFMNTSPTAFGNEPDRLALLAFKDGITQDPLRIISSWNNSVHYCNWTGVACSVPDQRVVTLNLVKQRLVGSMSPSIGNLTFLTAVHLGENSFNGKLPHELGRLTRLQRLNLSSNLFGGEIPINLTHCLDLEVLILQSNELEGNIPDQLSSLTKLQILSLSINKLHGKIPPWIGNFSSLSVLSLARNSLSGSIPNDFSRLSNLKILLLGENRLNGTVPASVYNLSSINVVSVANNLLHGRLPPNIGSTLPNLRQFSGGINNFDGQIPVSFSNASMLQSLNFPQNRFIGLVPMEFGRLANLTSLNFGFNQLGSGKSGDLDFFYALSNCTSLEKLGLNDNSLGGEIPNSIANMSQLTALALGGNLIHGSIPTGLGNLVNLTVLGLEQNLLSGSIPIVIGKLQNLQMFHITENRLSGLIPSSLGNLSLLYSLYLQENNLEGNIPPSLGNCQSLIELNMSHNNLNGTIPKEVISLSSLSISFTVSHNSLSGSLPLEVGNLKNLGELDVSENSLSGEIPSTLASCIKLERLNIKGNSFEGLIPGSLDDLRGIQEMDLSRNKLSGQIPKFLMNLTSLRYLNLSNNDFYGDVPKEGIFANASAVSVFGNNKLCGGIPQLQLPLCSKQNHSKSRSSLSSRMVILIIVLVLVLVLVSIVGSLCWIRKMKQRGAATTNSSSQNSQMRISYSELFRSTNGFSSECLIGEGSFGSVYKAKFQEDNEIVAVKVLNLQQQGASKSFTAECEVLKNIRHRNLIKIITACSSLDSKGNSFKALVMEYMPNGNLEQWLHPRRDGETQLNTLSFVQRLDIAIDVASAMDYLHYHCQTPIAHCDLKPSNILLDKDMTAHVGDFGLAKFLFETTNKVSVSVGLKGSIGYVPPEYGMGGQVSILGDVYSYGILLLEIFTGKRPTNDMFKDDLNLYDFAMMALPDRIMDIIDPLMLPEARELDEDQEEEYIKDRDEEASIIKKEIRKSNGGSKIQECLFSVITVGLSCSRPSPKDRMLMRDVVHIMQDTRDSYLRSFVNIFGSEKTKIRVCFANNLILSSYYEY